MMSQLDVLDLCFLTEEEKRRIKQVLQRDIDLQKIEKKRLQRVQKKMPDVKVKKKMTGEWFSSIKDQRYRGKPDGTELVWKSMEWESGLKPGQHRKEPRVPKQTDSSLERRVPLQSTIPAHLPVKNKQVVDEFGRQRRDEPVLSVNDPTANLQSEEPSRARRNPFGEADLAAELSSGTGRSDEESSEKENEWHHADPTKERDPAGMTRPLTDSKKQLTADQSEPYAHSSRQPGEVATMKNTLALMAQQTTEDDTRQLNRTLGLTDFQVPDEKIKEENKTAELSKPKISSPTSGWGTGTKLGSEEILQPKQMEVQRSSLSVNSQSASIAVDPFSAPEKPRRLNRETDRGGVTQAGTVNPIAAPPASRQAKPWDENFFQAPGMKGSPDSASPTANGLPSVEYPEGNKANRYEDHKPISGLKPTLSMDEPEFWTTPRPTDQKTEQSQQVLRKPLDEDFDYLGSSKKYEPLVDISTEMRSNDAPTWSAMPGIKRVDGTEQVQKQTRSDLEYKFSPEKSVNVHSASVNPQPTEQQDLSFGGSTGNSLSPSMLIDFSDEHNDKPKANIFGTMSLKEEENARHMKTGSFNEDLAGIDVAWPMQPNGDEIVDNTKMDKWPQREKDSTSSKVPSMMSSTDFEQQKKPYWDSQPSILKDQEHHLPYSGIKGPQQTEISKTIKWDSKRSHSQDDILNVSNKFDNQQVRKGSLDVPQKIDTDPVMSQNTAPAWTSVKDKVSAIERIIGHVDETYESMEQSNQLSDLTQRRYQEPIQSKPQTTLSKSKTTSFQPTLVVEELISAIKVEKKKENDTEDMLRNLYKMAAVGKVSPDGQHLFSAMGLSSQPQKMTDTIGDQVDPKLPKIQEILERIADQTPIPVPIPELPKYLFSSKSEQKNVIDRSVNEDQKRVNQVNHSARFDEPNLQKEVRPQKYVPQRRCQEPIRSKPQTTISKDKTPSNQATPVVEELISAIKVEKKKNDAEDMLRNLYKMAASGKVSPATQHLFSAMGQPSQPVKKTGGKKLVEEQKKLHFTSVNVEDCEVEEPIEEKEIRPDPSAGDFDSLYLRAMQMEENNIVSGKDEKDGFENRFSRKPKETAALNDVPQRRYQEPIRSKPQTTLSKSKTTSFQPTLVVEELISAIKVEKKKENDTEDMLRNLYKMAAVGKVSPDGQHLFSAMGLSSQPQKRTDTIGDQVDPKLPKIQEILERIADQTPIPVPIPELPKYLFSSKSEQKNVIDRSVNEDQKRVNQVNHSARFDEPNLQKEVRPQKYVPQRRYQEPIRSKPQTTISKDKTPSNQATPVVEELISAIKVEKKKNDAEDMLRNLYKMAASGNVSPAAQHLFSAMGQPSQPVKKTGGKKLVEEQKKLHFTSVNVEDCEVEEPIEEKEIRPDPSASDSDSLYLRAMQMKENNIVSGKDEKDGFENRFSRKPKETAALNDVPQRRYQEPIRSKPQTTLSKSKTTSFQPTLVVEELISAIKVEKKKENDTEDMLRNLYKMAAVGKVSPDGQHLFSAMGLSSQPQKRTDTIGDQVDTKLPKIQEILERIADQTPIPVPIPELPKYLFSSKSEQKNVIDRSVNEDQKRVNQVNHSARFDEPNLQKEVRPQKYVPQRRYQEPIRSKPQTTISKDKTPSNQATPVVEELISAIKVEKKKENDTEDMLRNLYKMAAVGKVSPAAQHLFSAMGQPSETVNTSNLAGDKDPELGNDHSEIRFSRTFHKKRDHAAADKSGSPRKQRREVIADPTTSSKDAEEDVRIRASSSFENQDELPPYPTSRDPVPRDWDQQVNAPPIAGGQNQNRTVSPSFDIDAPNDHYSQPPPPPVRTRMTKASNLPDDEVMTKTSSLQQRSAPRNAYENQESAASKILARSKNKMSRSLDDILESNSEDPVANAGKQEVGPAVRVPEKGTNLPQAAKLSRSVPVLNPSDEEAESPDSWSEGSQMSEQTPKRLGGHAFSTSSAGSITSSMMSLYSEAGDYGNVPITGEVEFALRYNDRSNELLVHISRCRDLAAANEKKKRSDAYVKTYLLPDRSRHSKRKTVIKKKTLSPKYDEVLKYKIEKSDLANRILNLSVWHNDMFGRNVFLGEVNLILNSWDWINQTLNWYSLQPKDFTIMEPIVSRGQITLGLKYVPAKSLDGKKPTSGEVHIWIQNAYNLVPVRSQGVDSFVKCYILPDTSRQSRQKTRVIRKDCNPEYNHTMVYDGFHAEDLHEACIELTIWDYERFSTNQFLGGVRLSFGKGVSYGKAVEWMDSQGEEIRLYKQLLEKPNEWNQGILPLRPQMATAQNPHK
uniref:uncharacterized protein isoform X2 n=1 Tax=Myxine glutinosa TaxID=7769 RepID=UPI00358F5957